MDIIILALISGFLFYQLYSILGTGNIDNSQDLIKDVTPEYKPKNNESIKTEIIENNSKWQSEIKHINEYDKNFSEKKFNKGATKAYEMIFEAYNKSDDKILQFLTSPEIYKFFKEELSKNLLNNKHVEKSITALSEAEIINIKFEDNIAIIETLFTGEQVINKKNLLDGTANSRKIKFTDRWKWTRDLSSNNSDWILIEMN